MTKSGRFVWFQSEVRSTYNLCQCFSSPKRCMHENKSAFRGGHRRTVHILNQWQLTQQRNAFHRPTINPTFGVIGKFESVDHAVPCGIIMEYTKRTHSFILGHVIRTIEVQLIVKFFCESIAREVAFIGLHSFILIVIVVDKSV